MVTDHVPQSYSIIKYRISLELANGHVRSTVSTLLWEEMACVALHQLARGLKETLSLPTMDGVCLRETEGCVCREVADEGPDVIYSTSCSAEGP